MISNSVIKPPVFIFCTKGFIARLIKQNVFWSILAEQREKSYNFFKYQENSIITIFDSMVDEFEYSSCILRLGPYH